MKDQVKHHQSPEAGSFQALPHDLKLNLTLEFNCLTFLHLIALHFSPSSCPLQNEMKAERGKESPFQGFGGPKCPLKKPYLWRNGNLWSDEGRVRDIPNLHKLDLENLRSKREKISAFPIKIRISSTLLDKLHFVYFCVTCRFSALLLLLNSLPLWMRPKNAAQKSFLMMTNASRLDFSINPKLELSFKIVLICIWMLQQQGSHTFFCSYLPEI